MRDQVRRSELDDAEKEYKRGLALRKAPSISESLDWARSLVILNAETLDRDLVESTLTMLVKHEKDLDRVKGALDKVLADLG